MHGGDDGVCCLHVLEDDDLVCILILEDGVCFLLGTFTVLSEAFLVAMLILENNKVSQTRWPCQYIRLV